MADVAVTVLGGGVAGLSTALLLARQGHPVVLIERDRFEDSPAEDAQTWERRGIPHFLQPHAFIPRARSELRTQLPDVYAALLEAGATEIDGRKKMPTGSVEDGDEELQYLAARRPLIEWALRRAVDGEDIEVRDGVTIDGLHIDAGRITGVGVDGKIRPATVVVDALGRRTPTQGWLAEGGIATTPIETSDCGVVYYSRYYRTSNGFELPDGPLGAQPARRPRVPGVGHVPRRQRHVRGVAVGAERGSGVAGPVRRVGVRGRRRLHPGSAAMGRS